MSVILITGSASGLGGAMTVSLRLQGHEVIEFDKAYGHDVLNPPIVASNERLDVLINNAGFNYINWLEHFPEDAWDEVMDTNAKGIYMMTRAHLDPLARSKGTVLNIVSNASHVPMTCSLAYNASKAAAHMMTLQLARELGPKYDITVFGISPNKLAGTGMSDAIDRQVVKTRGWTAEEAHEYQLKSLPAGEETEPNAIADLVAFLLSDKARHKYLAGCVIPYGA